MLKIIQLIPYGIKYLNEQNFDEFYEKICTYIHWIKVIPQNFSWKLSKFSPSIVCITYVHGTYQTRV